MKNITKVLIALAIFVVGAFLASSALVAKAKSTQSSVVTGALPGWGYGDTKHVHSGPPGVSVRP